MGGSERLDLEHSRSSIPLDLDSKQLENVPHIAAGSSVVKPPDSYSSHGSSNRGLGVHTVELVPMNLSAESDPKQVIPLAISLSSSVVGPCVELGLEGTSASRATPAELSMSEKAVPHNLSSVQGSCTEPASLTTAVSMDALPLKNDLRPEDGNVMQSTALAGAHRGELPPTMSLASGGSYVLQLAPAGSSDANVALETEDGNLESADEGTEQPLKKEKIKKRPRQLLQDARTRDLNKSSEKQPVIRWKDVWVAQLIHIRGRMHATFTSPQRQRVDLWQIVKHEMANSCHGFDKDSEACRKKWIRVYKEYKDDLHLASDEKTQKCRFYDLVDFYMGDRANSFRNMALRPEFIPFCQDVMHAAKELGLPPPSSEVDIKAMDVGSMVPQPNADTQVSDLAKKPPLAKKPRVIEKPLQLEKPLPLMLEAPVEASSKRPHMKSSVQTMLSELVNIGKEMLQTTREFEKEKLAVLHSIKDTLGKIAKKI